VVNSNAAPAITNVAAVDVDCNGANNGTITITANGGTGALQYSINNGTTFQASSNFANLAPGNYTIAVIDAVGCVVNNAATIIEPPALVANTNTVTSTCSFANGSVTVNANGGTAPLQYSNNNGASYQAGNNFANLASGNYQVLVQDANGCSTSLNANVASAPAAVINNVNTNDISCNGLTDGTITLTISGGTAPLQFSIDNGATYQPSSSFNNLSSGNYQIVVQDANGCLTNANAIIAQPAAIALNSNTVNSNCNQADGSLTVNANGGTAPFQYSIDNGASYQSSNNFGFLNAGNYNIIVQDANGCSNNIAVVVNNNAAPAISNVAAIDITCNGANNGSIIITANGGTGVLQYSINNGTTYQAANVFNNVSPGNYAVVVQDVNGCTVTSIAVIAEPALLLMNSNTTTSTCGIANGTVIINANGGTVPLQYSINNGTTFQSGNNFANLASGAYQLMVTDANGCTASVNANVGNAPSAVINNVVANDISCNGLTNGSVVISATGGTAPLQYSIDNGATYQTGNNFSNLSVGNLQIVVQDANGCLTNSSAAIVQPAAIVLNSNTFNSNCNQADGSISINANGGSGALQYSIDNGVSFQPVSIFNFIAAGNYNIIVQDANGCTNTVAAVVNNNAAPAISNIAAVDITCNGANNGSINVTANGGTGALQYSINNGSTFQAGNVFNNISPGNYAIVVQDANGCTITSNAVVVEPALLVMNANTTVSTCGIANGSVTINANGGIAPLQYSNNNGTTYQAGNNFASLASGAYQLIVTDANGCTASSNANVGGAPSPTINNVAATDLSCNGSNDGTISISVTGGTAPLQYSIDNGTTFQPSNQFANVAVGNWQIVVQDANGCTVNSNAAIAQPAAINYTVLTVDATCGNNNGTLTINANGGAGALTFSIDNGANFQSGNVFNNLLAGNYNIVVQDANGCNANGISAVTNTAAPVINTMPLTHASCHGLNDGNIIINVTGGNGALTYSINGGITTQASNTFNNLTAGNYNIVITDASGCSVTAAAIINEPTAINVNVNTTTATCGVANGSVTVNANGGAGALQYSINNGTSFQPTGNFASQLAGNYSIVVQDANGCTATANAAVQNTNAPVIAGTPYTDITCNGLNNGTITVNANGGTAPLQYSINNGVTFQAANQFANVTVGNWQIVVQDAVGCLATSAVSIIEPAAILFNSVPADATCGNANGSLIINAIGGTAPLQYSINNGASYQPLNQFANLAVGNLQLVVQDANGCTSNSNVAIANLAGPTVANVLPGDVTCNGYNNGVITITANGGTGVLQYSIDNGSNYQSGNIFSNITPGNYQIVVQDANGCTATGAAAIAQPASLVLSSNPTGSTCSNANGAITLAANGGTTPYQYSIDNGITFQSGVNFASLVAANYNAVVQDGNGCTVASTALVVDAPAPTISSAVPTDVTCYGLANGIINITANGGTVPLQYSIDNGVTFQAANQFANVAVGNWQIVVKDVNGCTVTSSALIAQPQQINYIVTTTPTTCGNANGTITFNNVTGGTGVYQYSIDNGSTFQVSNQFANVAVGNWQLIVQDDNGCDVANTANIINIAGPTVSAINVTDVLCNGGNDGTITVNQTGGTGPFQFSIDNGATFQSSAQFANLAIGNYQVLITDANGCTANGAAAIAQPTTLLLNANPNGSTCGNANGAITLAANGGTTPYQYSIDNGITFQSGVNFASLVAANYNVVVQDGNGCTVASTALVVDAPAPTISSAMPTDITCYGLANGIINITANGGTAPLQYSIDNGVTFQAANQFTNVAVGNWQIVVQDVNGCTVTSSALIAQPQQINYIVTTTPTTCGNANGTITFNNVTGGTGVYQFSIDSGATFQSSNQFANIAVGNWQLIVQDINGCDVTNTANIINIAGPTLGVVNVTDVLCFAGNTGTATVNQIGGTGPFQFSIDNGATFQSGNNFNNLPSGNLQIVIQDANGCTVAGTAAIAQPALLQYNVASAIATCGNANGNLTLNATGGSGVYVFSIDSGLTFQSSSQFTNLATGNYNIVVQDANNCEASGITNITSAPAPVLALTATNDATCFGLNNGSLSVLAQNGTSPFSYTINNGTAQPSANFNGLLAGNYSIVVTDVNGCADSVTAIIAQPTQLIANAAAVNVLCNGGNTGSTNVVVNGGVSPYTYQWSGGAGSNAQALNLSASSYTVTVTDANNCTVNASVAVNQPGALNAAPTSGNVTCFGLSNGWASMQATGGVTPYQYTWGHVPANVSTASNLTAGSYSLTVTDANGCTMTQAYSISQPTQIIVNASQTAVSCFGGNNGAVIINANGGTGVLNYSINGGTTQSSNQFGNLISGNYSVTVTDANGCTAIAQTQVTQPTQLTSAANATNILCFGQSNGSVNVVANGGTPPYNYVWSGGATSSQVLNLTPGTYSVTVTDANGCTIIVSATIAQPTAIAAAIAAVPTICIGQNTSLTASANGGVPPYTFKWNTGYTGNPLAIAPSISTNYNVVVNDANGCTAAPVYRTVDVHPALAVVVSPNDTICEGESVSLTATPAGGNGGPYTYTWTGATSTSNTINVAPILTTTYIITINDGCTVLPATSSSTVKVNPLPVIVFAPDPAEGCVPLTVNFSNTTLHGGDYKWQFGDGNTSPDVTPTHIYTEPGVYDVTLEAESAEGCYNILVMDNAVSVYANPIADFTADPPRTTILHPVIQFSDLSTGANRWAWNFGDMFNNTATIPNPEHTYNDTGRYAITLIVMNNELCSDTTYGEIIIDGDVSVYIPNAFSPNNDGKNEIFNVYSIGISSANLNIYDRWGNLIHLHNSNSPHWDGRNQMDMKPCQQGVYVYVLKATDIFGKNHKYTGTVTLVR